MHPPLAPRLRAWFVQARRSSAHLLAGALTSLLALLGVLGLATSLLVVGLPAAPWLLERLRRLADWERERAGRWLGVWVPAMYRPVPDAGAWSRAAVRVRDPQTWRDLGWLTTQAITGYVVAAVVGLLWVMAAASWLSIPAYFVVARWYPGEEFAYQGVPVTGPVAAVIIPIVGTLIAAAGVLTLPSVLANGLAKVAARLLGPARGVALQRRIEHLARTRSDSVEAQATELRRIERDLHDGVQARLTSVAIRLGMLEQQLPADDPRHALAVDARTATEDALAELRHIVRTMYPPILADRGLSGALAALAAQSPVPVDLDDDDLPQLPAAIASAAYHVVAESLANVARHSRSATATVQARVLAGRLELTITDDGRGGADPAAGTGLVGLERRVAALDGAFSVLSPPGGPTVVQAALPLEADVGPGTAPAGGVTPAGGSAPTGGATPAGGAGPGGGSASGGGATPAGLDGHVVTEPSDV